MASFFKSVIVYPLTAGQSKSGSARNEQMDGTISSAVLASFFVCIFIALTLIFGALSSKFAEPSNFLWTFYFIDHVIGFVCIIVLSVLLYNKRILLLKKVDHSVSIKVVFLWIFGLGYLLKKAVNVAINVECITGKGHMFQGDTELSAFSSVVSIIITASEIGFISYFAKFKFASSKVTNYALYGILSGNIIGWTKTVIKEVIPPPEFNTSSQFFNSCYSTSKLRLFERKNLYPLLTPAETEFYLLSALLLLGMMSFSGEKTSEYFNVDIQQNILLKNNDSYDTDICASESDRLLGFTSEPRNSAVELRPMSFYVSIFTGFAIPIPLLIVTLIKTWGKTEGIFIPVIAYRAVEGVLNISLLIMVFVTFHALRTQCRESKQNQITACERLLIFSNCGLGFFRTFNIVAFLLSGQPHTIMDDIVFLRHFVVLLNSFFQTILIILAGRYDHRSGQHNTSILRIENCFVILHIWNFMLWFVSIFTMKNLLSHLEDENHVFGHKVWGLVINIIWPLNIFYCFHSSTELYGLYKCFNGRSNHEGRNAS